MVYLVIALSAFFAGLQLGARFGRKQVDREVAIAALVQEFATARSVPIPELDRNATVCIECEKPLMDARYDLCDDCDSAI